MSHGHWQKQPSEAVRKLGPERDRQMAIEVTVGICLRMIPTVAPVPT